MNDGNWTYEWQAGRQLKKMNAEGVSVSFKYDHNGLRTQKVLEHDWYPETTNYTLHGKLITHMTVDYTDLDEVPQQDNLHFFYDSQSRPAKVNFNDTIYTYVHNLQSDIVGILDSNGTLVVEYKYNAWGKLLSTTGTLADTLGKRNPFRYRGYVYDEETELYYLRKRYYNSKQERFINVDSIIIYNPFAYCANSPIVLIDPDGNIWRGAFHRRVQKDIIDRYGGIQMEVSVIKNTGGLGRIDLMRISSGECWEVKPYYAFAAGSRQLEGYVRGKLLNITLNKPLIRGSYISPKSIEYEGYTVNYWYAGSGIILYTYTPSKKSLVSEPAPKKQPKITPATEPLIGYRPEEEYDPSPAETGVVIIGIAVFVAAILLAPATGGLSLAFAW